MNTSECIFCAIIAKKVPSAIIQETKDLIVIKDINPKATVHYLIIPKKHVVDLRELTDADTELAGKILLMARELSQDLSDPRAFRLIANNGPEAGQCVFHLHMHFLAGKKLPDF